jgi:hypothetical protein
MGLSYEVLFVAFNFWVPENSFFHVFDVSGPSRYQMNWGKMHSHYFFWEKDHRRKNQKRGGTRAEWAWPTRPRNLAVWGLPVRTSGPILKSPFNHAFVSQKRGCPIFPEIYRGHGSGEASAPFKRGQILLRRSPGEGGKLPPSSSPLLLGVGGGLSITIITKIRTISIIITVIQFDPLVV